MEYAKDILKKIVGENDFSNIQSLTSDEEILSVLRYYTITRDEYEKQHIL